jgi:hypothetical protein
MFTPGGFVTFRDSAAPYMDPEGFFGQHKNPGARSTNNALLYTGTYYAILVLKGEAREEDLKQFETLVRACEVPGNPGLYYRHPNHTDIPQQHDDYIGIAAASYHLQSTIAKDIMTYGKAYNWTYDSLKPGSSNIAFWHYRFGSVTPHYKVCAGEHLGLIDQITWSISIAIGAFGNKDNASGKILDWLKIRAVGGKFPLCDAAIALWRYRMGKAFPNGMGDIFAHYFLNDGGYSHPFSEATKGIL